MALDPNIVGTDGNDFLQATPGINVIDGGAGDDEIVTLDGSNTILFDVGSGMDSIDFAPERSYQYAGFVEEAEKALAILNTPDSDGNLPSGPVTDAYFGITASKVLISSLDGVTIDDGEDVASILKGFKPVKKTGDGSTAPLGTVNADLARQAFQAILDWVNQPVQDVIQFGAGITAADLSVQVLDSTSTFGVPNQFQVSINGRAQDGLIFQLGRGDVVAVPSTGPSAPPPVPVTFSFADGTTMTLAELLSPNHDPVATSIDGQHVTQGQDFNFSIPTGTFSDPDAADTLTLSASAMDASNNPVLLPEWLKFDAVHGTFTGTPANGDVGSLTVVVTATDPHGASVSTNLTIDVENVNDAPAASMPGISATATQGSAFTYALPSNFFTDVDQGDALTMSASALDANGNSITLPAWLQFDPATGSFSGTPANGDVGNVSVQVTATDLAGASASTTLNIGVANVNDAPTALTPTQSATATQDKAFAYALPAGFFTDVDKGDVLTLSASALDANGSPVALPTWLKFDPATGSFSGTPANGDVGNVSVQVNATDLAGASASTTLNIGVVNVNDAPTALAPTQSATATQDKAFTYALPAGFFADVDKGDALTMSASALDANGKAVALPAWLKFNPATGSFSGTPANGDVGNLSVQVTATDRAGASASTTLNIGVANVNDAPAALAPTQSATATQGKAFTYALPAGFFTDVDKGDVLTMSASALDAHGNPVALPAWLKFDPATGRFSGTPANGDVGNLSVQVTATDLAGAKASTSVTIGVANINDAPEAMTPIADQSAVVGTAFSLTVPAGAFRDIDVGDTMKLGAMMANGNPLPSWLVFDAANGTLHGTPGAGAVGTMDLKIVATDAAGASASDAFALKISAAPISLPPPVDPPTQGKTFVGGNGNDTLTGTARNDVLQGNRGRDVLSGGNGDDKLYFSADASWSIFAARQNNGSPGHSGTGETISIAGKRQSQDILDGGAGNDTLIGTGNSDAILLDDTSSPAQRSGPRIVGIERIEAGAGNDVVDLTSRRYAYGNVTIDGGSGNDVLWSSSGNDVLLGDSGNDRMDGGAGNDYLYGGTGRDVVNGGEGVDVLQGGNGRDQLQDTSGNTLLDGGNGNDRLTGGSNNVLFIGGKGDDTIRLGSGSNVVAFDRGDGRDVIESGSGGSSTLSLGAGIRLQDLAFRRSGDNLVLETGNNESITFDNWYRSRGNQAFTKLQFVTEGMTGPGNSTELDDNVETFDFRKLVGAFDSARAKNPGLSRWALTNGLASFHLDNVHNNSKALGGDLAYAYGTSGSLAGIGVGAAQDALTSAQFGKESQALHPASGLKEGLVKLA